MYNIRYFLFGVKMLIKFKSLHKEVKKREGAKKIKYNKKGGKKSFIYTEVNLQDYLC